MRIHPIENYSDIALDRRQEFLAYALINLILGVAAILICSRGYHPITLVVAMVVVVRNVFVCVKKETAEKAKVTDMTQTFVELSDDEIICNQTSEDDEYESCEIKFTDVQRVFTAKKAEKRGFYIQIKDSLRSRILVNDAQIESHVFCVNGVGYADDDWNRLYMNFIEKLGDDVEIREKDKTKTWHEKTMKEEAFGLLAPWMFVLAVGLIHIIFAVM